MNFCIHRYFYENSPFWKKVREEEVAVQNDTVMDDADDGENLGLTKSNIVHFGSIDKRSLTSLTLLRSRIVKLLENSENHVHPLINIARHIVRHNVYPG